MAAAEIVPFAKTGGLADVVGALSAELAASGVLVAMVLPAYRRLPLSQLDKIEPTAVWSLPVGERMVETRVYRQPLSRNLDIYLVRADEYFDREGLYGDAAGDYPDNAERFALFSRAVLEIGRLTGSNMFHLHDWQTAPAAAILKSEPERYTDLAGSKTVLTIHNLAYQGVFEAGRWPALHLADGVFAADFEFYSQVNYLKAGLVCADWLTTVSPTYAAEIQCDGQGFGLEGILRQRAAELSGILNGVDYHIWNPEIDPLIAERYSVADIRGKAACKKALQITYGLEVNPDIPVIGMVTRLAEGKGLELLMEAGDGLFDGRFQFALLGSGNRRYEDYFHRFPELFPGLAGVKTGFDEALAHQAISGADILLMPSRREPCGLTQMYALKYGTVPIVRRTGGLADSIDPNSREGGGNGFVFEDYNPAAMLDTIRQAVELFGCRDEWQALMRRGMNADHSWRRATEKYLELFRKLLHNTT
jgi:starch synthase